MLEWRELPILDPLVVDQGEYRRLGGHARQPRDVIRRAAEARAIEQVARTRVVPVGGADRRQIL